MASVMSKTPSPYSSMLGDFRVHSVRTTTNATDAYFLAMALQMDWPIIPVFTALFGILTVCTGTSLVVLTHRGLNAARLSLLLCIFAMFGGTAAYWALTLQSYSLNVSSIATSVLASSSDITARSLLQLHGLRGPGSEPGNLDFTVVNTPQSDAAMGPRNRQMCAGTAALLVNIILGDAIVWWRAWIVCVRKTWVLCLAATLLLGTAGIGITETAQTCSTIRRFQFTSGATTYIYAIDGALFLGNPFGFFSSMVTLVTNVAATAVIGHQAWVHSRMARECRLNLLPSRVGVQALLALLVESGVLYCVLWALVVAFQIVLEIAASDSMHGLRLVSHLARAHTAYFWFSMYLIEAALVPLIAIYPTAIIILVTLGNSCFEAAHSSANAPPVISLPLLIRSEASTTQTAPDAEESGSAARPSASASPVAAPGSDPIDVKESVLELELGLRNSLTMG